MSFESLTKRNVMYQEKQRTVEKKETQVKKEVHIKTESVKEKTEVSAESKIKRIMSQPRNTAYIAAVKKADEMTEEDFKVLEMVQEHIEEQQKAVVQEQEVDNLLYSLSKCYIQGCKVHTLYGEFIHYGDFVNEQYLKPFSAMPERMRKGYDVYKKYPNCLSVEIYERHICVVEQSGKTTVVDE